MSKNPLLANYYKGTDLFNGIYNGKRVLTPVSAENQLEFIEALRKDGKDVNVTDCHNCNLLHVFPDNPAVVKAFVEAGGDLNAKNLLGSTPLHMLVYLYSQTTNTESIKTKEGRERFYELFKLYLELGADPNRYGIAAPLTVICARLFSPDGVFDYPEDKEYVLRLLDLVSSDFFKVNDKNIGPFFLRGKDFLDLTREFIRRGADPDKQYRSGLRITSELAEAISDGLLDFAEVLLQEGADPNICLADTGLPAYTELFHGWRDTEENFKTSEAMAELLFQYGADFNITNKNGDNILTYVPYGSKYFYLPVKKLLELGAKPIPNEHGWTPLHMLVRRYPPIRLPDSCMKEDIEALVKAGNDINAKSHTGETPFIFACDMYKKNYRKQDFDKDLYREVLKTLVQEGADINVPTKDDIPAIELLPKKLQKKLRKIANYSDTIQSIRDYDIDVFER